MQKFIAAGMTPDFDDIRKFARNLAAQSDGRINMKEWRSGNDEVLKIVLQWSRPVSSGTVQAD